MKILLIDPTDSIINFGLRVIASYLIANGHEVKLIFLPPRRIDINYDHPQSVYEDLYPFIQEAGLVGFSFVSNYFGQARFLTNYIKKNFNVPVIWGGIHPMAMPERSLEYADIVCMGEGEEPMLELANRIQSGIDYFDIPNLWFKQNNSIIRNEVRCLEQDLDKYPPPVWDTENQQILEGDTIVPLDEEMLKSQLTTDGYYFGLNKLFVKSYTTVTSRGCPYSCSYCCNNLFRDLYKGKGKILRNRSNENVIDEITKILEKYPFIELIEFFDDDFISSRKKDLCEFLTIYKERINLPFKISIIPQSVSEENINMLADAGLIAVEMGLQTASERLNKDIYKRSFSPQRYLEAARIINKHPQITIFHDVIFDNPWETTEEFMQSLNFMRKLPKPFKINAFSLTFFPGTHLYRFALEQNMIINEDIEIISKKNCMLYENKQPYLKFLFFLLRVSVKVTYFPEIILDILSAELVLNALNSKYFSWFWLSLLHFKRKLRYGYADLRKILN